MTLKQLAEAHGLQTKRNVSYPTGFKAVILVGGPMNMTVAPEPLVEGEKGVMRLSEVKAGDKVWALNSSGVNELTEVEKVLTKTDAPEKIKFVLENGETFICNPDDKVQLQTGAWVPVSALRKDDELMVNRDS